MLDTSTSTQDCGHGARIVATDLCSPEPESIAGRALRTNMDMLQLAGSPQAWPEQHVSVFDIKPAYLADSFGVRVILAGSPAGHYPTGARSCDGVRTDHKSFKQDAFYSMCWQTSAEVAVVMTFSASACGRLEWWTTNEETSGRILMVAPAWFRYYRPRLGLACELTPLADSPDTMVALYLPARLIPNICWEVGKVDVAASIAAWIRPTEKILTLGAYTAELEVDLLFALSGAELCDLRTARHGPALLSAGTGILSWRLVLVMARLFLSTCALFRDGFCRLAPCRCLA
jgi:hypothetical protein